MLSTHFLKSLTQDELDLITIAANGFMVFESGVKYNGNVLKSCKKDVVLQNLTMVAPHFKEEHTGICQSLIEKLKA